MRFQKRKPRRLLSNSERQEILVESVFNYDMLQSHNESASWRRQILQDSDDKINGRLLNSLIDKFTQDGVFDSDRAARQLIILEKCVKKHDNLTRDIFGSYVLGRLNKGPLPSECLKLVTWAKGFIPCFYAVDLTHLMNNSVDQILALALAWFNLHTAGQPYKMEVVK